MEPDDEIAREERAIYLGLVLAGGLPSAGWLVRGGAAGAGIAVCLIMMALGLLGLVQPRPMALPRARVRR